jgi:hypothetical protein
MHEDIGQLKVSMHNFVLDEGLKGVDDLHQILDGFVLVEVLFLFESDRQVPLIAVLNDEIEVIGSLFNVIKLDDISIITGLEHFDLVLQQLHKLAYWCHLR